MTSLGVTSVLVFYAENVIAAGGAVKETLSPKCSHVHVQVEITQRARSTLGKRAATRFPQQTVHAYSSRCRLVAACLNEHKVVTSDAAARGC